MRKWRVPGPPRFRLRGIPGAGQFKRARFPDPGQSGNPETRFKPGNPHRWQSGQSGNPSGIVRSRLKFEEAFFTALIEQGAPLEAATLLWTCARAREPWAVQALLQRLAPDAQRIKVTHEDEHETSIDSFD